MQLQPFLHDLVTTFAAPTQVLSSRAGDIRASLEGQGAQGVVHADIRMLSTVVVTVNGREPEHIATSVGSTTAQFSSLLRHVGADLVAVPDPQVRLDRRREVSPGLVSETLTFSSVLHADVATTVSVDLAGDFASIEAIKVGAGSSPQELTIEQIDGALSWSSGTVSLVLHALDARPEITDDGRGLRLTWSVTVPAGGTVSVGWTLGISDSGGAVVAASTPPLRATELAVDLAEQLRAAGVVEPRLQPWLEQSLSDLNSLRMATPAAPEETFFAAGSPWYLTLFGRDSLWAARMILPVDTVHAVSTLHALARLAGTTTSAENAEDPGKIMHELRRGEFAFNETSLPPLYYGTIDATPLWVCLLHDVWKTGVDEDVVRTLLPTLQGALAWLTDYADPDGDGFLEYVDASGHGLANQGWKDSGDSVRFADGTLAEGPVALCEVQGYAYEAAIGGAAILEAFGLDGAERYRSWAEDLAARFRARFWCGEGEDQFPALALDGVKQRVDSVTSNMGHLLGTGILSAAEEHLVATRVTAADLDSGLGLRTMSSDAGGYSPLSYHCGSVWPHDTAVVIAGLVKAGLAPLAQGLVDGLLAASVAFDQRLPELWSGEGSPVPYAASCRPQAWSAASAVVVADALRAGATVD